MNERPLFDTEMPADNCEILPHRSVGEKLPNESPTIPLGFRKEENPGSEPIDAMHDKGPLSLRFQF